MAEAFLLSTAHQFVDISTEEIQTVDMILSGLTEQVLADAIKQAEIDPDRIESMIWGGDIIPQKQGLPWMSVVRPGLSGLQAVFFASQSILCGGAQVIAAGGSGKFQPDRTYFDRIVQQLLGSSQPHVSEIAHSHDNIRSAAGAAALILASTSLVGRLNLSPSARLASLAQVRPARRPINEEIKAILDRALHDVSLSLDDIAVFSIDAIWVGAISAWLQSFGVDPSRINPDQDGLQLSHTGEAEGVILLSQLIDSLRRKKEQWGIFLQLGLDFSLMAVLVERI